CEAIRRIGALGGSTRQLQDIAVVDVPVELGVPLGVIVAVPGVIRRIGAADAVALSPLGLHRGKQEQLVLDQRATGVGTGHRGPRLVLGVAVIQLALVGAADEIDVLLVAAGKCGRPRHLATEVPGVGASLADLTDHAAIGASVGGAVATTENFLLVDRSVGQRKAAEVAQGVGRVESI